MVTIDEGGISSTPPVDHSCSTQNLKDAQHNVGTYAAQMKANCDLQEQGISNNGSKPLRDKLTIETNMEHS